MKKTLLAIALLLSSSRFSHPCLSQSLVEDLSIEVAGNSREFAFTNKETAFFYAETNSANKSSWQGFNVFGHEFVDDYEIWIDEKRLERQSALKTVVYPDYLKRIYRNGIVEELRLTDGIALFSITVTSPKPIHVDVVPYFSDGRAAEQYEIQLKSETALIARKNHLTKTEKENYPVWLAIHGTGFLPQLKSSKKGGQFSPVMMLARKAKSHTIAFCVGDGIDETASAAKNYILNKEKYHEARRARMEKLLLETYVETDNKRFNKALAWAKLSLDALMMNQVTKGIFAGLPWFSNYWGRDTFISLPGATLVQGRFTEAKQVLMSFAAFQQTDSTSTDYGRIPNIVT
ncbi:MAG: amylo-alpha-1,6-glucosidase, partial [Bacteroidota bacterium]